MPKKATPPCTSEFALVDVKGGRHLLAKLVETKRVPVVLRGYIQRGDKCHSRDDGDSIEFAVDVVHSHFGEPEDVLSDKNGRPYAKLADLDAGSRIDVDDDFKCVPKRKRRNLLVRCAPDGLFFACNAKRHYLSGQLEEGGFLVGVHHACR